jgi:hypothetical protein
MENQFDILGKSYFLQFAEYDKGENQEYAEQVQEEF